MCFGVDMYKHLNVPFLEYKIQKESIAKWEVTLTGLAVLSNTTTCHTRNTYIIILTRKCNENFG